MPCHNLRAITLRYSGQELPSFMMTTAKVTKSLSNQPGSQRDFPCRFNTSVQFGLPDERCRAQILHQYAKHLSDKEVVSVAAASVGMAGRDLKDLSEQAERRWASKVGTCNPLLLQLYCCQHSSSRSVLLYPNACLFQFTSQVTISLKLKSPPPQPPTPPPPHPLSPLSLILVIGKRWHPRPHLDCMSGKLSFNLVRI